MPRSRLSRRGTLALWALVAFVLTEAICLLGVGRHPETIFDEAAHLDYVDKMAHGHVPEVYEDLGQVTLAVYACTEPRAPAWAALEPCGSAPYTPKLAPYGGLSTATNYAPTYYALTAVPYRVCEGVTSLEPRTCARVANTGWLAAAAAGFVVLMLLVGCSRPTALVVGVGAAVTPAILLQGITVNPDAFVHAAIAWLAVLAVRLATSGRLSGLRQVALLGVAGLVAVTAKETALIGFAVVLALWVFLVTQGRPRRVQLTRGVTAGGVFTVVVGLAALSRLVQPALRGTGGDNPMEAGAQVPFSALGDLSLFAFNTSMAPFTGLVWGVLANPYLFAISVALTGMVWGLGLQVRLPRVLETGRLGAPADGDPGSPLAVVAVLAAAVLPAVLVVMTWVASGSAPIQQRYFLTTATLLIVLGTATAANPWVRRFSAGVFALTTVLVVGSLLLA